MSLLEDLRKAMEKATGWRRPERKDMAALVRKRELGLLRFEDDGVIPNHPRWPLVIYRNAVSLPTTFDPAAVFEELFAQNGWGHSWRNGVYDYLHYHSRIHEVMGVAGGSAVVQFGGKEGRKVTVKRGDVVVLPAGTGHERVTASEDFLVVGAYPPTGTYDECRSSPDEHAKAIKTVAKVVPPRRDPIYGKAGPLVQLWKRQKPAKKRRKRA
jgi:uncharacterized protein YjlB